MTPTIETALADLVTRAGVSPDSTAEADARKVVAVIERDRKGGARGDPRSCQLATWLCSATDERSADSITVTPVGVMVFSGQGAGRTHRNVALPAVVRRAVAILDKPPRAPCPEDAATVTRRVKWANRRRRDAA